MHLLHLSTAIASLLALTTATRSPSVVDLVPRRWFTSTPHLYRISLADNRPRPWTKILEVGSRGPPYESTVYTVLEFQNLPANATGCHLKFTMPARTTPVAFAKPDLTGIFSVDIFHLHSGPLPTWNHPTPDKQKLGAVEFSTRSPATPYETILWSGLCPQKDAPWDQLYLKRVLFSVETSTWQQLAGGVVMANSDGKNGYPVSGFTMVYSA